MNENDDFDDWWVENKQRLFELYNDAMDINAAIETVAYEGFKGGRKECYAKTK